MVPLRTHLLLRTTRIRSSKSDLVQNESATPLSNLLGNTQQISVWKTLLIASTTMSGVGVGPMAKVLMASYVFVIMNMLFCLGVSASGSLIGKALGIDTSTY